MSDDRNITTEMQHGKEVLVLRKKWPDRSEYRRNFANKEAARTIRARIDAAIKGYSKQTWQELKAELDRGAKPADPADYTISQFADIYEKEYCQDNPEISRPEFQKGHLKQIRMLIGKRRLRDFTRVDVQRFQNKRAKGTKGPIKNSTVNRSMSVLSGLLTYAHKTYKVISENPMAEWKWLPEDEKKLRFLIAEEVDRIVTNALELDRIIGTYLAFLSETGLREEEGLTLLRSSIDLRTVPGWIGLEHTKNYRTREVPMSPKAIELYQSLPQVVGNPYVFIRPGTQDRLRRTRMFEVFNAARKMAGVSWACVHDLRHYRCTMWLEEGAPLHYVKEWMGHSKIETTMLYSHTSKKTAGRIFCEVAAAEQKRRHNWGGNGDKVAAG